MNKCQGCGISSKRVLCQRCFDLQNYNVLAKPNRNQKIAKQIINAINEDAAVFLIVDILDIPTDFSLFKKFKNLILVVNKSDQITINQQKIMNYLKMFQEVIIVSSSRNYNLDTLYQKLQKNQNNYFVGYVNAGKSSLINKLLYHYGKKPAQLTTSNIPGTTQKALEVQLEKNLTIYDTPGIVSESILYYLPADVIKKLNNQKVKPVTYQIKQPQTIVVLDEIFLYFEQANDITLYLKTDNIKRIYQNSSFANSITIKAKTEIIIPGLGFVSVKKPAIIKYQVKQNIPILTRKPII